MNKKTKILHYCLMTSDLECKIKGHPQEVMEKLGITYQHATPQSLGDCWWFWNCENIPEKLPQFITEREIDPMECIGYGLSREIAEKIRDYKKKDDITICIPRKHGLSACRKQLKKNKDL